MLHFAVNMAADDEPQRFLISMNTPEGEQRRAQLSYTYTLIEGKTGEECPPWISSRMAGRHKGCTKLAVCGNFFSHWIAWGQCGAKGCIILEDDAQEIRTPNFDWAQLPQDSVTLLGGTVRTAGAWSREYEEFGANGEFLRVIGGFKAGVNPITSEFRFTMILAYYIPPNLGPKLAQAAKTSKTLRPTDVWLGKLQIDGKKAVGHLVFPNLYQDLSKSTSQINSPSQHLKSDLYCCQMMRKWSASLGFEFPQRGCDVNVFTTSYQAFVKSAKPIESVKPATDIRLFLM